MESKGLFRGLFGPNFGGQNADLVKKMWASTMEVFRVQAQKKLHEAVSCWEAEPMGKFWAARWVGDGKVINGRNQLNSKKWYDNWVVATQIFFNFHPENWGRWTHFDSYFCKWVETTN